MALKFELQPAELEQVVESVFSTMMGIDVVSSRSTGVGEIPRGAMAAAVAFGGTWSGAVFLECLPAAACRFAGSFLGRQPPSAVDEEVRDVWGELANMIAGNLKCALRPGIRISPPKVVAAAESHRDATYQSAFETAAGPFWLTVVAGD
jgi:CheY-specific phosphatase CheX